VGEVEVSTADEVAAKVAAAQKAKLAWKELSAAKRIELLRPIRDELEKRKEELAQIITAEMGKPIAQAHTETGSAPDEFEWYLKNAEAAVRPEVLQEDAESLHKLVYEPYGVAAVISPWNFPLSTALTIVLTNLTVGNTVVFKTSEECPLFGKKFEEIFASGQLPDGVFAEVYGDGTVGEMLARDNVDLICFTGSTAVGKKLYTIAADKFIKAVLEMGGSSPCVVFEDADLDVAAAQIIGSRFLNCGQVCDVIKRVIVHESVKDALTERLVKALSAKKIGDPLDESTDISTLVAKRQQELVTGQLDDSVKAGAHIVYQAKLDPDPQGAFVAPTILDNVSRDMRVWREEVFGPILPIMSFTTEAEALELANDTPYGLGSKVITKDTARAERMASRIEAGNVEINAGDRWIFCNPFGGYKASGLGRQQGVVGLRELCQTKTISMSK
jgi:acyl-CoA reductase-like NAD-dependent aldehyde dehydrogenase